MRRLLLLSLLLTGLLAGCGTMMGRPPKGSEEEMTAEQRAAVARIKSKVDGLIVWSSSRFGNHDLFTMRTDGSQLTQLTRGDEVDWYPRFSPDGKQILFCRSKGGWVSEQDSNRPGKWDTYVVDSHGGTPRLVVADASWATWVSADKIVFSRGTRVLTKELGSGKEEMLADSTAVSGLGGAELQNPHLSPDGHYLAMTLRGARRETGIFNIASKTWVKTGEGCQVNWFPSGDRIYWINTSGNGGSEVFAQAVRDGRPEHELPYEQLRFIDLPGQRSHEYFPQLDRSGKWLVWAATRRGHDHDIADYEIFVWQVGSPASEAARLTFHSGNDRWPDITIPAP